jgi:hypothetical protein
MFGAACSVRWEYSPKKPSGACLGRSAAARSPGVTHASVSGAALQDRRTASVAGCDEAHGIFPVSLRQSSRWLISVVADVVVVVVVALAFAARR